MHIYNKAETSVKILVNFLMTKALKYFIHNLKIKFAIFAKL